MRLLLRSLVDSRLLSNLYALSARLGSKSALRLGLTHLLIGMFSRLEKKWSQKVSLQY